MTRLGAGGHSSQVVSSGSADADLALGRARRKAYARLIPLLFVSYVIAYIDRVNVGFAALSMNKELGLTATRAYYRQGWPALLLFNNALHLCVFCFTRIFACQPEHAEPPASLVVQYPLLLFPSRTMRGSFLHLCARCR